MKHSTDRILVTHAGSLPRPHDLLDMMREKLSGRDYDKAKYDARLKSATAEIVAKQIEVGVDIPADGETSKPGFFSYIKERLTGIEGKPERKLRLFAAEVDAFPEYYADYFQRAMLGGTVAPFVPAFCTGPVKYQGEDILKRDLENLKAALAGQKYEEAFVPSTAPSGVAQNEYYKTDEEFFEALGEAMRVEYKAIVDAGFLLQVDDPFLSDIVYDFKDDPKMLARKAGMYVESINHALRGIPADRVRFHTCYGINDGPRLHEAALIDVMPHMLKINAQAFSFEAGNVRHEHEYHVFENVKLQPGQILIPGVITHASNIIEHPELVAERIIRFADRVGRENVIAGADCGFSSQATYKPEVNPKVMWEKFKAMSEGARIASKKLWAK